MFRQEMGAKEKRDSLKLQGETSVESMSRYRWSRKGNEEREAQKDRDNRNGNAAPSSAAFQASVRTLALGRHGEVVFDE